MNKIYNITYFFLFALSLCLLLVIAFMLFANFFFLEELLNIYLYDYLVSDHAITNISNERCFGPDIRANYNDSNKYSDFHYWKYNKISTWKDFTNVFKHNTSLKIRDFKVLDRTLSWVLRNSRPGGGRGL